MGDKYKMSEPWERLKKLRQAIGKKCDWSEEKNCGSLLEQVKWVRLQKSRKQIFYTAGHLHLEATVRYMTLSEAQLIIPSDNESLSVFPMLNIFAKSKSIGGLRVEPLELKLGKSIELFDAASESYKILTSPGDKNIESCHKDWTHLEKRWKVTNWLWHRCVHFSVTIASKNKIQIISRWQAYQRQCFWLGDYVVVELDEAASFSASLGRSLPCAVGMLLLWQ